MIKRSHARKIVITKNINPYAIGSVMVEFGNTKVHVTATLDESVPSWMRNSGKGWVTAEYGMLPGSTHSRVGRDRKGISGRSQEIQRLIGRALRAVVDMEKLGERQIMVDCDVIVADGGTRTASISGGIVALELAMRALINKGLITENPIRERLAAVSIGLNANGEVIADLNYEEDSSAEADVNIVMTESKKLIEVQGTAEGEPFSREVFNQMLDCAELAMNDIFKEQKRVLG